MADFDSRPSSSTTIGTGLYWLYQHLLSPPLRPLERGGMFAWGRDHLGVFLNSALWGVAASVVFATMSYARGYRHQAKAHANR
jgi:hypothetical protein